MADGLGRTVLSRYRFARSWGLGDRKSPSARTPALIIPKEYSSQISPEYAPFEYVQSQSLPSSLTVASRLPCIPPNFDRIGPQFSASIGHVLPPSLDEANAGELADSGSLLPVSWQRLHHDETLLDPELKPDIIVLTDSLQLTHQPGKFVEAIHAIKYQFPQALLWTPGVGGPDNIAVLSWFGVDLFDLARVEESVSLNALLSMFGPRFPVTEDEHTMEHQLRVYEEVLREVWSAIDTQTLLPMVHQQALNSPRLIEHLRFHNQNVGQKVGALSRYMPQEHVFEAYNAEMLNDPLVLQWVSFMNEHYIAPRHNRDVLVLLPCSARKPYRLSQSHRTFIETIGSAAFHEVMVTSPLGIVPRDLEDVWPASHYDVPVTGVWSHDEQQRILKMVELLVKRQGYQFVINHSGFELPNLPIPVMDTRQGLNARDSTALQALRNACKELQSSLNLIQPKNSARVIEKFRSISRFLLKNDAWLDDVVLKGKSPRWRIELGGQQLAVWSIERNGFSFSAGAIDVLAKHQSLPVVVLRTDIKWKGDVFFHQVLSYDDTIMNGDDVLIYQDDVAIGIARAIAPGWEWNGTIGSLAKSHQRKKN